MLFIRADFIYQTIWTQVNSNFAILPSFFSLHSKCECRICRFHARLFINSTEKVSLWMVKHPYYFSCHLMPFIHLCSRSLFDTLLQNNKAIDFQLSNLYTEVYLYNIRTSLSISWINKLIYSIALFNPWRKAKSTFSKIVNLFYNERD